jgi:hypothetical protein
MKLLGIITWVVTALAAIAIGLKPLGYRVFEMQSLVAHPGVSDAVHYAIGIFGVISLLMLVGSFGKGGCGCHHNNA